MTDEQFDDLRQLIITTANQTESNLSGRFVGVEQRLDSVERQTAGINQRLESLEKIVDDGFAAIGDSLERINQRVVDHEANPHAHAHLLQPKAA